MIDPETIKLDSLPCISLSSRNNLPEIAAIYFVLNVEGVVQYIGRTNNLKTRWKYHHHLNKLQNYQEVKISWLQVSDASLLSEIEIVLIQHFKPHLNRGKLRKLRSHLPIEKRTSMKVRRIIDIEVEGLGEKIKYARETDRRSLSEICRQIPMTNMNWYKIEAEETKALPIETLRRIEEVLGVDFGVKFDD